jgi:hypothetical protein
VSHGIPPVIEFAGIALQSDIPRIPCSCGATIAPLGRLRNDKSRTACVADGRTSQLTLQESVRHVRGAAPAQIPDAKISVCHGVGGMFAASSTIIVSNEVPRPWCISGIPKLAILT